MALPLVAGTLMGAPDPAVLRRDEKSLRRARKEAKQAIVDLGRQKIRLHESGLKPFVNTFKKITDVDRSELDVREAADFEAQFTCLDQTVAGMEAGVLQADSLEFGILAGLAAYGITGAIETAPPDDVESGRSDAAAGDVMLAWIGASDKPKALRLPTGLGMDLGNASASRAAMKTLEVATKAIGQVAGDVQALLAKTQVYLEGTLGALTSLVAANAVYRNYDLKQKRLVARTATLAIMASLVAQTPLFDEDGVSTKRVVELIEKANKRLLSTAHQLILED